MPTALELRELDDEELENRLSEYRREMLNLRFQLATGQLDNVTRLSVVRKDVARVLTVLRDREIALAEGRPAGPVVATRPPRRRPGRPTDTEDLDAEDAFDEDADTEAAVTAVAADTRAEDTLTEDTDTEDALTEDTDTEDAVEPVAPRRRSRRAKVVDEAPKTDADEEED